MCMICSRAAAFALCVSQVAITGAVIMFFPPVRVQVYTALPAVQNGTLHGGTAPLSTAEVGVSLPFLALSCVAVLYSTTTAGLAEGGLLGRDTQYSFEILVEAAPWDLLFWVFCAGTHALVILVVTSPVDIYALVLSSLLMFYFLGRLCAPRCSSQLSMTQENMNLLGYCAGLLITARNIPDTHSGRGGALLILALLDYMLGVGHTWDSAPTMDVVANCRLFYVCSASLCLAGLYGAWHDQLLIEH